MAFPGSWRSLRVWAAIVAAYALVLQTLLAGIVVAHAAAVRPGDSFVVCTSSPPGAAGAHDPTKGPNHRDACDACVLATASTATMPGCQGPMFRLGSATAVTPAASTPFRAGTLCSPKSARGPPARA